MALVAIAAITIGLGAAPAAAGDRINAPGVYPASIVYIPGISVPGGLPECAESFGRQVYVGQIEVSATASGYRMTFQGEHESDHRLKVRASGDFGPAWAGFLLGPLGGRDDALVGIDYANLEGGRVQGLIEGSNGRLGFLLVNVGAQGAIERCLFKGPGSR